MKMLLNFDLYELDAALMLLDIESEHVDLIVENHNIYMVKKE